MLRLSVGRSLASTGQWRPSLNRRDEVRRTDCSLHHNDEISSVSSSISIFGMGYVGSVSAACFAHRGHRVIGVDVNRAKVEMLEAGRSPILETRMNELVAEDRAACRLHATTDTRAAVHESDISFICVGTPSLRSGKLDLSQVEQENSRRPGKDGSYQGVCW